MPDIKFSASKWCQNVSGTFLSETKESPICGPQTVFSRCLLPEEQRGMSEAESPVDIVRTGSWEGLFRPHMHPAPMFAAIPCSHTLIQGAFVSLEGPGSMHSFSDVCEKLLQTRYTTQSCLLYTSPSPRDRQKSRMPSSA